MGVVDFECLFCHDAPEVATSSLVFITLALTPQWQRKQEKLHSDRQNYLSYDPICVSCVNPNMSIESLLHIIRFESIQFDFRASYSWDDKEFTIFDQVCID